MTTVNARHPRHPRGGAEWRGEYVRTMTPLRNRLCHARREKTKKKRSEFVRITIIDRTSK